MPLSSWGCGGCHFILITKDSHRRNIIISVKDRDLHRYLSPGVNLLFGTIPAGIGQLTKLQRLELPFGSLNGSIPASISALKALTYPARPNCGHPPPWKTVCWRLLGPPSFCLPDPSALSVLYYMHDDMVNVAPPESQSVLYTVGKRGPF